MTERKKTALFARVATRNGSGRPPGAGGKTRKSFDETHDHIVRSTFDLFSRKGYASTSTREIAQNAGITEVTLYRHFRSKEELFAEVVQKNSLIPLIENLPPAVEAMPFEMKLRFLVTQFMELFQQKQKVFKLLIAELVSHPEHALMLFEKLPMRGLGLISRIFEKEIAKGTVKKLDPRLMARSLMGVFLAYNIMQEILRGKQVERFDARDVIDTFMEIFLNGITKKERVNGK